MNKYIFLLYFFAAVTAFTSCSDSFGSEPFQTSAEQEFVTIASEEEKDTETTVSSDNAKDGMRDITEKPDINTITTSISSAIYETITESANTVTDLYDAPNESGDGCFNNIAYKFTAAPSASDVNDYVDKEIAAIIAYIVSRDEIYEEYREYYSALIFYTDGTCASGIFRDEHGIHEYKGKFTDIYDADEIISFDEIGSFDSDISEKLNECLNSIDLTREWNYYCGYKPYDPDEPEEARPAVVEKYNYDLVQFFDDKANVLFAYRVIPAQKIEDAALYAEIDDNYAKKSRDFLIETGIADYWLENYAWKIGK